MKLASALLVAITVLLSFSCCAKAQDFVAVATAEVPTDKIDPEAEDIDQEAFKAQYLVAGEEVGRMVELADSIEEDNSSFAEVDASGSIVARPRPIKCKDGPIKTIFRKPGFWYFPVIKVKKCARLPCPNNSPCLARRTVTRNVWAVCYKRFNCWGLILWIPISVQRLCVVDELDCECKQCSDITSFRECITTRPCPNETNYWTTFCYWKPFKLPQLTHIDDFSALSATASTTAIESSIIHPKLWGECDCCRVTPCPHGQFFDRRICRCRCRRIRCIPPRFQNPTTCRCVCPKKFDCGPHRKWNPITCKCECKPVFCLPPRDFNPKTCECECPPMRCSRPYVPDPSSCQCRCPKDIICPPPKFLNHKTCKCQCPPIKCPPNFEQDPDTCKCVCKRVCPIEASFLDPKTCKCVGLCVEIFNKTACGLTDSCLLERERNCRWFASFPTSPCQCDCCIPKNPASNTDCGFLTPWGAHVCNLYYDHSTQSYPCKWACT